MFNQDNHNNSSNINTNQLILELKQKIEENFNESDWSEVGLLTNMSDLIENHPRLLRSLYWGDNDYAANIINILKEIHSKDSNALNIISIQHPIQFIFLLKLKLKLLHFHLQ